ncbi:hypothetical protein U1Q18_017467 [Sarracenia purpurea var. burkii]
MKVASEPMVKQVFLENWRVEVGWGWVSFSLCAFCLLLVYLCLLLCAMVVGVWVLLLCCCVLWGLLSLVCCFCSLFFLGLCADFLCFLSALVVFGFRILGLTVLAGNVSLSTESCVCLQWSKDGGLTYVIDGNASMLGPVVKLCWESNGHMQVGGLVGDYVVVFGDVWLLLRCFHLMEGRAVKAVGWGGLQLELAAVGVGWLGAYSWEVAKGSLVSSWLPLGIGVWDVVVRYSVGLKVACRYLKVCWFLLWGLGGGVGEGAAGLDFGVCSAWGVLPQVWQCSIGEAGGLDGWLGDCSWEIAKGYASGYMLGRLQSQRVFTSQVAALLIELIHLAKLLAYMVVVKRGFSMSSIEDSSAVNFH